MQQAQTYEALQDYTTLTKNGEKQANIAGATTITTSFLGIITWLLSAIRDWIDGFYCSQLSYDQTKYILKHY